MSKTSLDKSKIKVLLLEGLHASAVEAFQADGYTHIEYQQKALPEPQLLEAISDAYVVGIRSATQLTARVFAHAPRLMGIGCFCIGTNQVDLDAAQEHGIPVFNAPFSNTRSVAELVLAEIILLLRGIPQRSAVAHRGGWVKTATGSHEARGKCLGIVGYGHIGTQTGVLAEALGMRVAFYDIETKLALGNAQPLPSLDALLEVADVVTLHVPETPQTFQMIGAEQLARMKPGARLINAARGTVVDINALVQALESKHLSGAALDVFPEEPKANDEEFVSPLRRFDNVLLTPHVGGSTEEAQQNIGLEVASKLIKYSNNGSTVSSVNFPEVALPEHPGKHRLLHIHRNQPGVLSRINAIFSERQINIAGQYLQTNAKIGYVVIDVDSHERAETLQLKKLLDEIAGTIRTRILY
ncbi:MAG TPA: phosphoglycerate dehydrogenase [Candidatus Contendobacter sp.]|nr:phosphoglycerate dehydrogenase [Candidatus Contendobacter sp.]HRD49029.1 phosphoglycerate dehydrogenase [Candidatus Contendobacter sp.]